VEITNKKILVVSSLLLICTLVAVGCAGSKQTSSDQQSPSEKETIKIGMNNWAENIAVCNMWKILLEERGYKVKLVRGGKVPIWTGVSKGDLDILPEVWLPQTSANYWGKYKDKLDKYGPWYKDANLGLVVPEYVEIDTIPQLKNKPQKFNYNGQPSIVGIDPGANIMQTTEELIKEYELDYRLVRGSGPAMTSALSKAYQKKEPIVVTLWDPHWAFAKFDLKYLEDPKNMFGDFEYIYFVTHNTFKQKYPQVLKWLKNWKMNSQNLGKLMEVINNSENAAQGAKKWIENNPSLVNEWFNKE